MEKKEFLEKTFTYKGCNDSSIYSATKSAMQHTNTATESYPIL